MVTSLTKAATSTKPPCPVRPDSCCSKPAASGAAVGSELIGVTSKGSAWSCESPIPIRRFGCPLAWREGGMEGENLPYVVE